ncbi:MAG: ABC transporter substrate-binding protein [Nitrospirae bacterium]|nr:ABC transporter substrate-binding protein [Nitrospirota bacterium]
MVNYFQGCSILRHCIIRISLCLVLLCVAALLVYVPDVSALDVTIIESSAVKPYEDAIRGFEQSCNCNVKKVIPIDRNGFSIEEIRKSRPGMVVAVGEEALSKSLAFSKSTSLKDIPTVYMMVLNPDKMIQGHENVTGVSMEIPATKQIASFVDVFPWIKRLGVIYNPMNFGHFINGAAVSAKNHGVVLVEGIAQSPKDVPNVLNSMKGKIDALWVLPDVTVVTPGNTEFIMLYSIEFNLPVLTFTENHVALGAAMSLTIDPYEIGRQTGGLVTSENVSLTKGKRHVYDASIARVSINQVTALKMAIDVKDRFKTKNFVKINLNRYGETAEHIP